MDATQIYLRAVGRNLKSGQATEHTHRSALQDFIQSFDKTLHIINEPKQIACGAPDLIVQREGAPVGWIEAKDVDKNLTREQNSAQLKRYRETLSNLILTDYLEFRWFRAGELAGTVKLAEWDGARLKKTPDGQAKFAGLIKDEFLMQEPPSFGRAVELAQAMSNAARLLQENIIKAFAKESPNDKLHSFLKGLKETLLRDMDKEQFADMMAQTVVYGLFAARMHHESTEPLTRRNALYDLPLANPFLGRIFEEIAGPRMDERLAWTADVLVQILARADMTAIREDFGRRVGRSNPVLHFYETFLAKYNPAEREQRGVYYTPEPVVSYITRSVDALLRRDFGLPEGLADTMKTQSGKHRVLILDPAVGTGTFLWSIIELIHSHLNEKGMGGAFSDYIQTHLLPRLFGFEIQMAPYTICHLALAFQLQEKGYVLSDKKRLGVFLTNTLEEAIETGSGALFAHEIVQESESASEVKRKHPVMVVLGNPPYSGESQNKGEWITKLMRGSDGKDKTENYFEIGGESLGEKNPKWVNDDYVKFIRFAQWRIEKTGEGILAFVTNHAYLDNPTFRGMRESLMKGFDEIYILDMHGNSQRKETAPDGSQDKNVFDIRQGVAIGVFIRKRGKHERNAKVSHANLWGGRGSLARKTGKYGWLANHNLTNTKWKKLKPASPDYLFIPCDEGCAGEYKDFWKITDAMPLNSAGMVTARDSLTIQWTQNDMKKVAKDFSALSPEKARAKYRLGGDVRDWKVAWAQGDIRKNLEANQYVTPVLYRPFDKRFTYYTGKTRGFICMPRRGIMRHMLGEENLGLITVRQQSQQGLWRHVGVTNSLMESCAISNKTKEINYIFPLYADIPSEDKHHKVLLRRKENLDPGFISALKTATKTNRRSSPEAIFHYIYAILHSPAYRERYTQFLKLDFPRIPLPGTQTLFTNLSEKGGTLRRLHLMEDKGKKSDMPDFKISGSHEVERVRYGEPVDKEPGRVYINADQYFRGVPQEVWGFPLGGYLPAQKWLKSRKGRKLSFDDIEHYRSICAVLAQTRRLMSDIDATITKHGGFPKAFHSPKKK